MNPLPFRILLYRYFFFGWLFREIPQGATTFEQRLALHHNRRQAAWLPVYMMRWLWCGLVVYGVAGVAEQFAGSCGAVQCVYAASALCVSIAVMSVTAWVGLRHRP